MAQAFKSYPADKIRMVRTILSAAGLKAAAEYMLLSESDFKKQFRVIVEERAFLDSALKAYDIPKMADDELRAEDDDFWQAPETPTVPDVPVAPATAEPQSGLSSKDEAVAISLMLVKWPLENISAAHDIPLNVLEAAEPYLRKKVLLQQSRLDLDLVQDSLKGDKSARRTLRSIKPREDASYVAPVIPPEDADHFFTMTGPNGKPKAYRKDNRDPAKGPTFSRDGVPKMTMMLGQDTQRRRMAEARVRSALEQRLLAERADVASKP